MLIGCGCHCEPKTLSSSSSLSDSFSDSSASGSSSSSGSSASYSSDGNECLCCYEGAIPQRYRFTAGLTWSAPAIKCIPDFEAAYNDVEVYYRGVIVDGASRTCYWTTNHGMIASNFMGMGPIDCPNDCYQAPAHGLAGYVPAVQLFLTTKTVGDLSTCYFYAILQYGIEVAKGLDGICRPLTNIAYTYNWALDVPTVPYVGCFNSYVLKKGPFTPVDANIEVL